MTVKSINNFLQPYPPQDIYPAFVAIRSLSALISSCSLPIAVYVLEELGGSLSSWVSAQAETISDDDYKNTVSQEISYALSHVHGRDR